MRASPKLVDMATFFLSSRRRHTRLQGDWSSDVCSSDLRRAVDDDCEALGGQGGPAGHGAAHRGILVARDADDEIGRASWGKSVDLGGRRIIKKKKKKRIDKEPC